VWAVAAGTIPPRTEAPRLLASRPVAAGCRPGTARGSATLSTNRSAASAGVRLGFRLALRCFRRFAVLPAARRRPLGASRTAGRAPRGAASAPPAPRWTVGRLFVRHVSLARRVPKGVSCTRPRHLSRDFPHWRRRARPDASRLPMAST
jgi:hypothetical protein